MNFYENYLRMCRQANKSPSKVATDIGLSKGTVNRWKNGGGYTDSTLHKISEYFGVPVSELENVENEINDSDMFYDEFIRLCVAEGKNSAEVARELGISKSTISCWKYRKSAPSAVTKQKIANYFGVPVSELETGKKEIPASVEADEDVQILLKIKQLDPDKKKAALLMLDGLLADSDN